MLEKKMVHFQIFSRGTIIIFLLFSLFGFTGSKQPPEKGRFIQSPDYWLNNLKYSNKSLMDQEQIGYFNKQFREDIFYKGDIFKTPKSIYYDSLHGIIEGLIPQLKGRNKNSKGKSVDKKKLEKWMQNLNKDEINELNKIWMGVITKKVKLQKLPSSESLFSTKEEIIGDMNFAGILSPGSPVVVIWVSEDEDWGLVQSRYERGWVPLRLIARERRPNQIKEFCNYEPFIVITSPTDSISVGSDEMEVCMGTRLPLQSSNESSTPKIWYPGRDAEGFLVFQSAKLPSDCDFSNNYLSMTQENIMRLSLRWLLEKKVAERDSPEFIVQSIFSCFNLRVHPQLIQVKDSEDKIKPLFLQDVGHEGFNKKLIKGADVFSTILCLNDGLGIYLGKNGEDYLLLFLRFLKSNFKNPAEIGLNKIIIDRIDFALKGEGVNPESVKALYHIKLLPPAGYF